MEVENQLLSLDFDQWILYHNEFDNKKIKKNIPYLKK